MIPNPLKYLVLASLLALPRPGCGETAKLTLKSIIITSGDAEITLDFPLLVDAAKAPVKIANARSATRRRC